MNKVIQFQEKQYLRDTPFVWVLYGVIVIIAVLMLSFMLQMMDADSGGDALGGFLINFFVLVLLLAFVRFTHLDTRVAEDGLHYQFFPFHTSPRQIAFSDIEQSQMVSYQPLREYGGWGIRYNFASKTRAFTVYGREGVLVTLKDGKKILIGSGLAPKLAEAIQAKMRS